MNVIRIRPVFLLAALLSVACESTPSVESAPDSAAKPQISFGDGEHNWIVVDGVRRDGATFTFPKARIDGNGWLVLHPFENGKPNGMIYSGATYIADGENEDVAVKVDEMPAAGDRYLVMLHRDVNENRTFDFVFVDEHHVEDRAVFEGTTMISHVFVAP